MNKDFLAMTTYTRIEAAAKFNVSNTIIRRNLSALETMGFGDLLTEDNRLTERAIYLIELYRAKDFSMLDDELAIENEATEIEAEVITEADTAAGSLTLASTCQTIADRTGTIALTSSEPYEQRAAAARSALAQFVATNNERGQRLATNAATTRRSFEQLGQEHAIGHLMSYAEALNATLAEGMAAMQNGAVSMADNMGKHAAESVS
jgi:hypothetical protein